jgi:hypothetical protein
LIEIARMIKRAARLERIAELIDEQQTLLRRIAAKK